MVDISERRLEEAIEAALTGEAVEPEADGRALREARAAYGNAPGGYLRRSPEAYDRTLCLDPEMVLSFVFATQPKEWVRLTQHHGAQVKERFLRRLAGEVGRRGTLDVLRNGVKDSGCSFKLAYFPPSSGLNAALQTLYRANLFSVVRQLRYSGRTAHSLDMVLFLNGLPLFTLELKNPLTGQSVRDAMAQYRSDRNPKEPLFQFGRCLAHFAVDSDLVYMTAHLQGMETRFLPFNRGNHGGAGNPPSLTGFSTAYLWEEILTRESVLNLIRSFIHVVEEEDDRGRKTGSRSMIVPRYHQLDAVRRLVGDARERGAGHRYLIEHSAGSGKSNSIAWLAHQLSTLHDDADERVFDSIVVVTDRRVLDRQLQGTVRQFQQTLGVVENIDKTSRQLREALDSGKTIIVTTLQKFPVISKEVAALPGRRFAVIVDEAHSSQGGEGVEHLKRALSVVERQDVEEEQEEEEDLNDLVVQEMKRRGHLPNVSTFAFTATPKRETLELFGERRLNGSYEAFSLYSMRQAIEEGFILDVLENYTTYTAYWNLLKTIEDDPRYDRQEATVLLKAFVDMHEHTVAKKVEIVLDHFRNHTALRIGGRAKAMIATRSRRHAVRYKLAVDRALAAKGLGFKALVAFSGSIEDGGKEYTEAGMNGFSETRTAETFKRDEYRLLVVANKFQTGFDQPLLHTMYVDKKLSGVTAVQTLSRLNRVYPGKEETMVLDFANSAETIQESFARFYERTILSDGTDPNLLYDLQGRLANFQVFGANDLDQFAAFWFTPERENKLGAVYAVLAPALEQFNTLPEEGQAAFRAVLTNYIRFYSFLSQVITFVDADLEKLYVFGRLLLRRLPVTRKELPIQIEQSIDIESYRIQKQQQGKISVPRGQGLLDPVHPSEIEPVRPDMEALSHIVRALNERFGTSFSDDDKVFIRLLEDKLSGDPGLEATVMGNPPENARLSFNLIATDRLQELMETNFAFYKKITDDEAFGRFFLDWMFDRYRDKTGTAEPKRRTRRR
jgi:type I restriction enzyme R subunit